MTTDAGGRVASARLTVRYHPSDPYVIAVDIWTGLALVISSPVRESSATYNIVRYIPLRLWGAAFLAVAVMVAVSLYCRRHYYSRAFDVLALITRAAGPALYTFWAVGFLFAALSDNNAALVAVGAYAYVAYRHMYCPVPGGGRRREG